MTHIFGYIRVSLDDQNPARQKESLANQCARFFIYFASGKDTKRPELSRILDEIRYGDMVFRHCRDSLGRSLNDLLRLTEERTQRGVTFQSIKEGLHFEGGENVTSTLKPILMLVGAIAEFKRNIIKKRQPEGIELAKMRGAFKGSARRISGEKVSHMKHLIKEGVSLAKTARIIGISRTSAYRYLKANNPENATKVGIQRISREGDNSASGSKL